MFAVVAEWVYERLQIQVSESHRSQVGNSLGTENPFKCPEANISLKDHQNIEAVEDLIALDD